MGGLTIRGSENLAQESVNKSPVTFGRDLQKLQSGSPDVGSYVYYFPLSYDDETYTYTLSASWNELYAKRHSLVMTAFEVDTEGRRAAHLMYLFDLSEYNGTYQAVFKFHPAESSNNIASYTFTASDPNADMTAED